MIVARPRSGRAAAGREAEESRGAAGLMDDWSTRRVAVAKRAEDSIEQGGLRITETGVYEQLGKLCLGMEI